MHQQVDRVNLFSGQTASSQPDTLTGLLDVTTERLPTTFFIEPDTGIDFLTQAKEPIPLVHLPQDGHRAKFAVSDQKNSRSSRNQSTYIGQQSQMFVGAAVTFDVFDPGPGDRDSSFPIGQAYDQQLMAKANLGAVYDQADFSQMPELCFQPLPSDGFVPFPHSDSGVIQQPAQPPGGAQQFGQTGDLPGYAAQAYRPALMNTNDQPGEIPDLRHPLVGSQFLNPLKPGMIEIVDRHVAAPVKIFCGKNYFTRFCSADQLLCC
jgi:hypothetical protein